MALSENMGLFSSDAKILANVVLPTPGGPQKIMEGSEPARMANRSGPSSPTTFSWTMYSSKVFGRRRAAKGILVSKVDAIHGKHT